MVTTITVVTISQCIYVRQIIKLSQRRLYLSWILMDEVKMFEVKKVGRAVSALCQDRKIENSVFPALGAGVWVDGR